MLKKQALKSGAIHGSELVTRRQGSYRMASRYNILQNGKVIFEDLGQVEYFSIMEDLAVEYYQNGTPHPDEITYEIMED